MGNMKKKGTSGNATRYITRNRAVKKLHITLNDFRRLCILKGIHPVEPKNRKKANKGNVAVNTFYYQKDIQFLSYEPLINTLRERKIFARKITKATKKKQEMVAKGLKDRFPKFNLNHIIKERYPTFIDALRDLDDPLSMIFLFATMPPADKVSGKVVEECKRLSLEFLHYIIKSRSLRKTFLSIKGIYYQVEIQGQEITWLVPYQFSQKVPKLVDFKVMLQFLEFYRTLLGFINFKLYSQLNLVYPPTLDENLANLDGYLSSLVLKSTQESISEAPKVKAKKLDAKMASRLETLESKIESLAKEKGDGEELENGQTVEEELDDFPMPLEGGDDKDTEELMKVANERQKLTSFQSLFSSVVIYLNREVPKNSLEFIIRCFGGRVGWDSTVAGGSPFSEDDPSITHHIVDRPKVPSPKKGRIYIQPQWVYDSVNQRKLLEESRYAPGASLPPHLSPFVVYKKGDYIPDEAYTFQGEMTSELPERNEEAEEEINDSDIEGASEEESEGEVDVSEDEDKEDDEGHDQELQAELEGVKYSANQSNKKNKRQISQEANQREAQDLKEMSKMMMTRKQKYLYSKLTKVNTRKNEEVDKLKAKKQKLSKKKD